MNAQDEKDTRRLAFGVAGQAVAHFRFAHDMYGVSIVPPGDGTGFVQLAGPSQSHEEEQYVMAWLVGSAAQTYYEPGQTPGADDLINRYGSHLKTHIQRARAFVCKEWVTISSVARQLLMHRTLDFFEIEFLSRSATGRPQGRSGKPTS